MLNSSYNDDNTLHDRDSAGDREISVGTSSIVGIFFVLALICAAFFGIGYTLGRRQSQPATFTAPVAATTTSSVSKPSPGSPAKDDDSASAGSSSEAASAASSPSPSAVVRVAPGKPVEVSEASGSRAVKATPAAPAGPGAPIIVQIAAVSHHEDADVLISALSRRGYTVAIRQEPQDKLFHVQIGPFANRKEADAMRQRLLADGYNAIVK
jgi:DedD protein